MFRIKICGITSIEDALLAAEAGADAIGLNFYEKSPRFVTSELALSIVMALAQNIIPPKKLRIFGVFVNASIEQALEKAGKSGVVEYQFHGDEPPETVANIGTTLRVVREAVPRILSSLGFAEAQRHVLQELGDQSTIFGQPSLPFNVPAKAQFSEPLASLWFPEVIRAFRVSQDSLLSVSTYLRKCESAGAFPDAVLLDAHQPGAYGGTGQVVDWNAVRDQRDMLLGLPLILAGGLTPENVAEAIATAQPDAVDVASGVESAPGKKDPAKVRAFVAAAKKAFAALDS